MSELLGYMGLVAQLGFFAAIAIASVRHFAQDTAPGHRLIQIASPLCTIGLAVLMLRLGPVGPWPAITALAMTAAGYWVFRRALAESAPGCLSVAFGENVSERLMVSGIYGVIRNPLYTSYLLYWAAWPVLLGLIWPALAVAIFFALVYWLAVRQEETALATQFGPDYLEYQARTGRFFPRVNLSGIFRTPKP